MSKTEIRTKIDSMEQKLAETKESAMFNAGPVRDALRIVIPMVEDQLVILKELCAALPDEG